MTKGRLLTVSFRLPYRLSITRSKLVITPSTGGLATALRSYFESGAKSEFASLHWIGVSDFSSKAIDKLGLTDTIIQDDVTMHPVTLAPKIKRGFYDGFCNSVLWPLFHYFPSFAVYQREFFREYLAANEIMCQKVLDVYQPGDVVWVHDYHWMILPSLLRKALPHAKIGFFLHIPFPSFELYRLLPKLWRTRLIAGLVGADVVGFQSKDFVRHFIDSAAQIMPEVIQADGSFKVSDRVVTVKHFPISVDYEKFNTTSQTPETRKNARRIRERLTASKLILSVDRLDYTKAIFSRLESFELFLAQNSEFIERVTYVLLLVPTREAILKYRENKLAVEALISRVNGKYGRIGWTPVVYQYQSVDFKRLVALYCASDIALVVPSRDGMNLVAKEYVACRPNLDGVLILSETAGAAGELPDAILVNPNDRQEVADAILEGLLMGIGDQKRRMDKMQRHLRKNDVLSWATDFLGSVMRVEEPTESEA